MGMGLTGSLPTRFILTPMAGVDVHRINLGLNGENVTDEFVDEFADAAVISTVSSRLQEVRSPGAVPTVVSKSESEPRLRGDLRKPRGVSSLTSIIFAISFSCRKTSLRLTTPA